MGIIKSRKNKKFDYKPRYYDNEGKGSPFELKHKFDEYRTTTGSVGGIKTKFVKAFDDLKNPQSRKSSKTIMIIIVILLLIFLFIIDFDLSIFRLKE